MQCNCRYSSTEVCDNLDNDCDGTVDDGLATITFYEDFDSDSFGNFDSSLESCSQPAGFVTDNTDCDDADEEIFPGAPEFCDGQDNDCDTLVDEGGVCATCGNDVVEGPEVCDGTDLGAQTCATQGLPLQLLHAISPRGSRTAHGGGTICCRAFYRTKWTPELVARNIRIRCSWSWH